MAITLATDTIVEYVVGEDVAELDTRKVEVLRKYTEWARARIESFAPDAPSEVSDAQVIVLVDWMNDNIVKSVSDEFPVRTDNAFRLSGVRSAITPWRKLQAREIG